jgi:uncharacterized membrane protein YqjE
MAGPRPSLALLARRVLADLLALLEVQVALFSTELRRNASQVRGALLLLALAGALVFTGLTLLLVAAVLALAAQVGAPMATLIVGGGAALAGLALGWHGLARLNRTAIAPRASIDAWHRQVDRLAGRDHDHRPPPGSPSEGAV